MSSRSVGVRQGGLGIAHRMSQRSCLSSSFSSYMNRSHFVRESQQLTLPSRSNATLRVVAMAGKGKSRFPILV